MSEIWVLVDTAQDKVRNVTYEVLAAASKLKEKNNSKICAVFIGCLLYTSPSPRDVEESRMPSSA